MQNNAEWRMGVRNENIGFFRVSKCAFLIRLFRPWKSINRRPPVAAIIMEKGV